MSKVVYDLLTDIAARCDVTSEKVLRKSKELIALLNSKQKLNCSDTCKVVVCLELASSLSSIPLRRNEAVKYSGYKKSIYSNYYNNISKLLNLDKVYSVAEICLLLGVADMKEPATKLLQDFKKTVEENDFEHPMYPCAAVLAYSRGKKVKLNITKLVEISRMKKAELEALSKKFSDLLESNEKNYKTEKRKVENSIDLAIVVKKGNEPTVQKKKNTTGLMSDKEYEEWKRKMLEE